MTACGRNTKAGTACKGTRPTRHHLACRQHATADEDHYGDLIAAAWSDGYAAGSESARELGELRVQHLEQQLAELRAERDAEQRRHHDADGRQLVEVGRYSYTWNGDDPLAVGDDVMLPENYVSAARLGPGPWRGTVSALGSTYVGAMSPVLRRAEPAVVPS